MIKLLVGMLTGYVVFFVIHNVVFTPQGIYVIQTTCFR